MVVEHGLPVVVIDQSESGFSGSGGGGAYVYGNAAVCWKLLRTRRNRWRLHCLTPHTRLCLNAPWSCPGLRFGVAPTMTKILNCSTNWAREVVQPSLRV